VSNSEVKQHIQAAIDCLSEQSTYKVKRLLSDPAFKQNIKEAINFCHVYTYKKVEPTGKLSETQ
jgi:hypothetical protein